MEAPHNQLIYAFPRMQGEEIQINLQKYKDKYYIDLRLWYQPKNESVLRPTKKGIFVAVEKLPELRKGLDRMSKATEKLRRITEEDFTPLT